jgi:hypothetical protein
MHEQEPTEMGKAAWYSDTRALYILRPIPVHVHVGCPWNITLRVSEASDQYTSVIAAVDAAAPAREEAAEAAAEAEREQKSAGASVVDAAAAKAAADNASAAALAATRVRAAADELEVSWRVLCSPCSSRPCLSLDARLSLSAKSKHAHMNTGMNTGSTTPLWCSRLE